VNIHVFACDYDGTIADGGRCSPEVAAALGRVRESGRKILLVTGRMLSDLRSVCADVDRMFDAVVAENGAVLYFPETREATTLGDAPESALVEELRRRGVPFDRGPRWRRSARRASSARWSSTRARSCSCPAA